MFVSYYFCFPHHLFFCILHQTTGKERFSSKCLGDKQYACEVKNQILSNANAFCSEVIAAHWTSSLSTTLINDFHGFETPRFFSVAALIEPLGLLKDEQGFPRSQGRAQICQISCFELWLGVWYRFPNHFHQQFRWKLYRFPLVDAGKTINTETFGRKFRRFSCP